MAKRKVKAPKGEEWESIWKKGDEIGEVLDAALNAAEEELQRLLEQFTPETIAEAFATHVRIHLEEELTGATRHDNDCETYREAVNNGEDE